MLNQDSITKGLIYIASQCDYTAPESDFNYFLEHCGKGVVSFISRVGRNELPACSIAPLVRCFWFD